jgi:hypothetical protein
MTTTAAAFPGMTAVLSDLLTDGATVIMRDPITQADTLLIGTRPLSPARAEGRRIVREGLAAVLDWLGWPVEPTPGHRIYAMLRGQPTPQAVADVIPLATSTFPAPDGYHRFARLNKPPRYAFTRHEPDPEAYVPFDVVTIAAETFAGHATVQYETQQEPELLLARLYDAVRDLQHQVGHKLRTSDRVADVTHGLPAPTITVEMRLRTWPAVPGVTTPELPTPSSLW